MHRNVAVAWMGKKRHVLMIPCASRCTQECRNRGDKIRVMRRGLGRAVETTMQREKETTKLESSSIRVRHASEGQRGRRQRRFWAYATFYLSHIPTSSNETSSGGDKSKAGLPGLPSPLHEQQ